MKTRMFNEMALLLILSLLASFSVANSQPIRADHQPTFDLNLMAIKPNPSTGMVDVQYQLVKQAQLGDLTLKGLRFDYTIQYCGSASGDPCFSAERVAIEDNGKPVQDFTVVIDPTLLEAGAYTSDPNFFAFYYYYDGCVSPENCEVDFGYSFARMPRELLIDGKEHQGLFPMISPYAN